MRQRNKHYYGYILSDNHFNRQSSIGSQIVLQSEYVRFIDKPEYS